ncbi:hypothetical protein GCM10009555_014580 [Acrocarpospora macrocephala]|uniref:Transposase n=1 Tax=Acrocarpospora macrocephala TaxID=150177 RepID=A0A5M3WGK9_9ACTN|nr:DUF6262 family protein [Acrocarpospora macrocephala]GES08265.1 hypothetical protein Amac_018610 [Acrocarpospora macrocephala]
MSQRSPGAGRTPGDVLREVRRTDSQVKRGKVLATLEELKSCGEPITFRAVAAAARVSTSLVYSPGVREHIETAIAGQAKAARRATATGTSASAASLACDLELARAQIKQLRAERDKLKAAVQRGLGTALASAGSRELTARIDELLAQVERLATERDDALAENARLKTTLTETEDNLTAARTALKDLMKEVNRDR